MRRFPLSFLLCTGLGILCAIPGLVSMTGFGHLLHPLLADEGAGLAFVVSAVALIGSGLLNRPGTCRRSEALNLG